MAFQLEHHCDTVVDSLALMTDVLAGAQVMDAVLDEEVVVEVAARTATVGEAEAARIQLHASLTPVGEIMPSSVKGDS